MDTAGTFSAVLFLSCSPKRKFGSQTEQEVNAAGTPKWACELAVTFSPQNGIQTGSEVISVTIAAPHDPAAGVSPGTAVNLEGFRVGLTPPEKSDNGRIRGGKAWYQATAVRPAHVRSQPAKDAA